MRIGIIGCGAIAQRSHIPQLQAAGADLVAFASRTAASAERAAGQAGTGTVCSWQELVSRPDVDAVVITSPNDAHVEHAVAAAEAGKHLLVEKPLARTTIEAEAIIAAVERTGVVGMTAHDMRFAPPVLAAHAVDPGEVSSFHVRFCHGGPRAWAPEATWFYDLARAGGGSLLDLGVHAIDTLRFLLEDEIACVSAVLSPPDGPDADAVLAVRTAGGRVGTITTSWRHPAADVWFTLVGERQLVVTPAGATLDGVAVDAADSAPTVQDAFLEAIQAGRARHPDLPDGRAAVAVVEAAYRSAASGTATAPR